MKPAGLVVAFVCLVLAVPVALSQILTPDPITSFRLDQVEKSVAEMRAAFLWLFGLILTTLLALLVSLITYIITTRRQKRDGDPYRYLKKRGPG